MFLVFLDITSGIWRFVEYSGANWAIHEWAQSWTSTSQQQAKSLASSLRRSIVVESCSRWINWPAKSFSNNQLTAISTWHIRNILQNGLYVVHFIVSWILRNFAKSQRAQSLRYTIHWCHIVYISTHYVRFRRPSKVWCAQWARPISTHMQYRKQWAKRFQDGSCLSIFDSILHVNWVQSWLSTNLPEIPLVGGRGRGCRSPYQAGK